MSPSVSSSITGTKCDLITNVICDTRPPAVGTDARGPNTHMDLSKALASSNGTAILVPPRLSQPSLSTFNRTPSCSEASISRYLDIFNLQIKDTQKVLLIKARVSG